MSKFSDDRPGQLGSITAPLSIFGVVAIATGGLVAAYVALPAWREDLKFAAAVVGGGAAVYAAFYVGLGLRRQLVQSKLAEAFAIGREYVSGNHTATRALMDKAIDLDNMTRQQVIELFEADPELERLVKHLMNFFEVVARAAAENFADEDTLYEFFEGPVKRAVETTQPFIDALREKHNAPKLWQVVEELNNSWVNGMSCRTRKPLHAAGAN